MTGNRPIRLFLCGDVMTGRGIDQVLSHPANPGIHEAWVTDARDYVDLAERIHGEIPAPVAFDYIWGDGLAELDERKPDVRLINLETSITRSDDFWRGKGINYRMDPANIPCLGVAGIQCCALANNHVLDWGYSGLIETLKTLGDAGIAFAGAGRDLSAAATPAILDLGERGRVLVLSLGFASSGIPETWAARDDMAGVNWLAGPSTGAVEAIAEAIGALRRSRDIVVASIHWGSNWGYSIPDDQRAFGRRLIDEAGVDIVHGHSSHHPRAIEVHGGKAIIYGCGDLINDYEGIRGHEAYRGDLSLMYILDVDADNGRLLAMELVPMQMRRFRLTRASQSDRQWLMAVLKREGQILGTRLQQTGEGGFWLQWN